VDVEVSTAPSDSKTTVERNETSSPLTSKVSSHAWTAPIPGISVGAFER